jgi:hypothetical protein
MNIFTYSVTEDLDEKSLYLSILKTRDADMISSASTTNRNNKSILAVDDENSCGYNQAVLTKTRIQSL